MKRKSSERTQKLTLLALLFAIELLFAFTPLGYLRVGVVEITFMTIPIAIAAMLLGPAESLILGCLFGLTSFLQATSGASVFGGVLLAINPFFTFVLCFVPRALMGWLVGVIFRAVSQKDKTKVVSFIVTSLSAALLNTIFFVLFFYGLFHGAELDFGNGSVVSLNGMNILDILIWLAGINGLVEAGVCTVVAAVAGKALVHLIPKIQGD